MDSTRVKNSVGIWAFGPNATRFVPIEVLGLDKSYVENIIARRKKPV
ncbi:MAG TPA: hypothetical protein VF026_23120 [Ktedonobacteraceae bacterium]